MDTGEETRSARVHEKAIPTEEAQARRQRWAWVEPSVWTDRMLAALENGVQGGKWFSLIDKVHRKANLASAFREVKRNGGAAGVDHVSVAAFDGNRFGFRPGRGAKDARRGVDRELKACNVYVVDADIYLHPLDQAMRRAGYTMIRYADDLVILCERPEDAAAAQALLKAWVEEQGLVLHPDKTRIVNLNEAGQGFDFLGYHFERTRRGKWDRWPRRKSLAKLKTVIRPATHRANGKSLPDIIATVNRTTRGWYEYFKQSNIHTFPEVDGWIRGRLRAILRNRAGLRGRGRGRDHHRWNNAYFAAMGYFSLTDVRMAASQSA